MSLDISFYRTSPVTVFTRPRQLVQPGSRCGSDPSHHETGGCRVETGGGGSGMSAPIDSWLARIDRPEFTQEGEHTLLISELLGISLVVRDLGNRINVELGDTVES